MKALSNIALPALLLATLAALPAVLIAFRQAAGSVAAAIPTHASAVDQAEFWLRVFGG